jgi:hypothetical protein
MEFSSFRIPQWYFHGLLDWTRWTRILTTIHARSHCIECRTYFHWINQGQNVCYSCVWASNIMFLPPTTTMWLSLSFQSCLIKHGQKLSMHCNLLSFYHSCVRNYQGSLPNIRNCILLAIIVILGKAWQGHPALASNKTAIIYFTLANSTEYVVRWKEEGEFIDCSLGITDLGRILQCNNK